MSEEVSEARAPRPERADRPERPERPGGGGRPDGDRGGYGRREERAPLTVKGRLRAKARKKARKAKKKGFGRKKVCRFCADTTIAVDYKDAKVLRVFIAESGKLIPARVSGNCAKHQRQVCIGVKRARQLALMPYTPPAS